LTLRLRLVLALAVLAAAGLAVFGITTYGLYSRSQHQRLDDELRGAATFVTGRLRELAGLSNAPDAYGPDGSKPTGTSPAAATGIGAGGAPSGSTDDGAAGTSGYPGRDGGGHLPGPPPLGTYGILRDASGKTLSEIALADSTAKPKVPTSVQVTSGHERLVTVGAASGSAEWRVAVVATRSADGGRLTAYVALPLSEVSSSLDRFVLIEAASAGGLLLLLALGAWLILRSGLRPLEHMASTAGTISAGALDQRVTPDDARTEVGQLGKAINTMLGELEVAFAEREATEQRLRQFLADASHELRTPLTSIQGFAELFRLGVAEQDHVNLEVISRRIEQESARMKTLVEGLLLLARLDQTREIERAPVNVAVLAADACSDAVAVATDRRITLDAPEPVVVLGDQDHLRQAIANLVSNTLRHTPEGSPVEVTARVRGNEAEVVVRDHGPGLDPDALAHAFDRFWQADAARAGTGAGLGLSIVASIAAEHGGRITATNAAAPDAGAVFTLTLPLHPTPA